MGSEEGGTLVKGGKQLLAFLHSAGTTPTDSTELGGNSETYTCFVHNTHNSPSFRPAANTRAHLRRGLSPNNLHRSDVNVRRPVDKLCTPLYISLGLINERQARNHVGLGVGVSPFLGSLDLFAFSVWSTLSP